MSKRFILFLASVILLNSCEKSTYLVENDPLYPAIINKISPDHLNTLRMGFARQNIYLQTSLDEYGFCGYGDEVINAITPTVDTIVSASESIEIAKQFIERNSLYTGVKDITDLSFQKTVETNNGWNLFTTTQIVDTIEVLSTTIYIRIKGREVYNCTGNWFPDIYIPKKINLTSVAATHFLLNRTVTHYTWGGPVNIKITSESLQGSTARFVVVPIEKEDHLEICVVWKIYVPKVDFILYVDAMTGEIIGQEPTVIS